MHRFYQPLLSAACLLMFVSHAGQVPAQTTIMLDFDAEIGTLHPELIGVNHPMTELCFQAGFNTETGEFNTVFYEAIAPLGLKHWRYPGGTGSGSYFWQRALGDYPREAGFYKPHTFCQGGGTAEHYHNFGTMELMDFLDRIGAHSVTVNLNFGSEREAAQAAADWVEFANALPGDNPNGGEDWAALRESLGHPAPYGIRYWEVGNEPDIGEDGGCPYRFKPDSYVRYYQHTVAAILRADPKARVGGPAVANVRSPLLPALLDAASADPVRTPLHFVSWHIYSSNPLSVRNTIEHAKGLLQQHPDLHVETFLDEWNLNLGFPPSDARVQPCYVAEVAWQMKDAGLDYSCYYHIRDYHVSFDRFKKFMSPQGTAFMEGWWNRMPQFDGLFDFQDKVRPTYFTFKLLSRLTGDRLRLTSDSPTVHGFATRDDRYMSYRFNLMLWNFSTAPVKVEIAFEDPPGRMWAKPIVLDALTAHDDEIARLRPEPPLAIDAEQPSLAVTLEPYQVRFWLLEQK